MTVAHNGTTRGRLRLELKDRPFRTKNHKPPILSALRWQPEKNLKFSVAFEIQLQYPEQQIVLEPKTKVSKRCLLVFTSVPMEIGCILNVCGPRPSTANVISHDSFLVDVILFFEQVYYLACSN